jgi:hypothetical protein
VVLNSDIATVRGLLHAIARLEHPCRQLPPVHSKIGSDWAAIKLSSLVAGSKSGYTRLDISQLRAKPVLFAGLWLFP